MSQDTAHLAAIREAVRSAHLGMTSRESAKNVMDACILALKQEYTPPELFAAVVNLNMSMQAGVIAAASSLEEHKGMVEALLTIIKTQRELDQKIMRLVNRVLPQVEDEPGG